MTNQPILPIIFNNFLSFDNVFFRRLLIPDWVIFAFDACIIALKCHQNRLKIHAEIEHQYLRKGERQQQAVK